MDQEAWNEIYSDLDKDLAGITTRSVGDDGLETLLQIERLHEALAAQSAAEQEVTRQQIDELVRTLRQGGVFGKYDAHSGFIQEPPSKQRRKKG